MDTQGDAFFIAFPRAAGGSYRAVSTGLLGWGMSGTGWPRAPLLIGFVLAGPMERYFVQTTGIYGWSWLQRPGC